MSTVSPELLRRTQRIRRFYCRQHGPLKSKKPAERFRASGLMSASYEFASHTAAGTVSCDDGDGGAHVAA
jgi:hypothetical protein